jgi:succinate dehydrogenase/fumarate reductase cytochrome b subunit
VSAPAARPVSPLVQRLLTGSGALPLAAFLVAHLAINAFAVRGVAAFARVLGLVHKIPALGALEALFIFAPLGLHAGLGAWLTVTRRPLPRPSPYPNGIRVAMRATGAVVLVFLLLHLPEYRLRGGAGRLGGEEAATLLAEHLSSTWNGLPWLGLAYLLGTGCAVFHLGAGAWGLFASSRRGQASPIERARAAWAIGALSTAMWLGFANVVALHATGAPFFGGASNEPGAAPCPSANALPAAR